MINYVTYRKNTLNHWPMNWGWTMTTGMRMMRMDENTYKTYKDLFKLIKELRHVIMGGVGGSILLNRLNELLEFIAKVKDLVGS